MTEKFDWETFVKEGLKWAKRLQPVWQEIMEMLAKRHRILVLGASGAGKTQFVRSLRDPRAKAVATRERTETVERRRARVEKKPFLLIDTPGQEQHAPMRERAIRKAVEGKGKVDGIINVTCFGYHEAREDDAAQAVPTSGKRVANPRYLAQGREAELGRLAEWVPHVDSESCPWVLTVITKADLWWPERTKVMHYYQTGKYATRVKSLKSIHSVLPNCSTIRPFLGGRTSGEFGDEEREALRARLLESLRRLAGDQR